MSRIRECFDIPFIFPLSLEGITKEETPSKVASSFLFFLESVFLPAPDLLNIVIVMKGC